ncbi:hypothetical protein A6R71_10180 [Xanthomonas translucens pv. arrhenatheri]|nr:hypothetical protein A6R71_10180 [Xanthomonas translucens pv. arrhenatheri]
MEDFDLHLPRATLDFFPALDLTEANRVDVGLDSKCHMHQHRKIVEGIQFFSFYAVEHAHQRMDHDRLG